ncbi:DUF397 domain-containing protein [Streptomyces sp. YU58]|uniref:DUF397 domain-containing protein n=1 Tax=Streptomyces sp. SX92 TaxID=3158972 RepID=UPI0027BB21CC|nr:DUF397 domain-containing protein [Streptomyces coralus]WLW53576.1 DUF397 domain-containing protein [Streptomyces coralus]
MNEAPITVQFVAVDWSKSSYSAANNECVEVAHTLMQVGIRDSKTSGGDMLVVSASSFAAFIAGITSAQ